MTILSGNWTWQKQNGQVNNMIMELNSKEWESSIEQMSKKEKVINRQVWRKSDLSRQVEQMISILTASLCL